MPLHSPVIILDVRPENVDALLTLISMTGQGACGCPFYLLRRRILLFGSDGTIQLGDCWMGTIINCWCSVDAHLWAHLRDILTVIGSSTIVQKMHTVSIGSQYTVSIYSQLNPRSWRHFSFWATTIHGIYMINNIALSYFNAFGRQFMAWKSIHLF
jgi:hypothetical protein